MKWFFNKKSKKKTKVYLVHVLWWEEYSYKGSEQDTIVKVFNNPKSAALFAKEYYETGLIIAFPIINQINDNIDPINKFMYDVTNNDHNEGFFITIKEEEVEE